MTFTRQQLLDAGLPDIAVKTRPITERIEHRTPVQEINIYNQVIQGEAVTYEDVVIGEEEYYATDYERNVEFVDPLTAEQWKIFEDIRDADDYVARRKREYPPLEEFADAYYWEQKGEPQLMNQYIAKVNQVKLNHPAPGGGNGNGQANNSIK